MAAIHDIPSPYLATHVTLCSASSSKANMEWMGLTAAVWMQLLTFVQIH